MKTLQLLFVCTLLNVITINANAQIETSRIWVTFNNDSDIPTQKEERLYSTNPDIQKLINEFKILHIEQAFPDSRNPELLKVYEVEAWSDRDKLMAAMERSSSLSNPERAPEYDLLSEPNDYHLAFSNDYALDLIQAQQAWDITKGDSTLIIGISDGNFFLNHEELKDNYIYYGAGYSYNMMLYYHGTAVATLAAGNTDNNAGKSSIGYNCRLALTKTNYNALLELSYLGARVINVSWSSGCWYSSYAQTLIDEVYNNGSIIVAAAGNGGTCGGPTSLVYPAAFDHVIAVSSVGPHDNHERTIGNPNTTHQHNESVDICAPGYDVALTVAPNWYLTGNGTSFAAPIVSGTIGLMLSLRPCLNYESVLQILQSTAKDLDALNPNYAGLLGAGRLDAGKALESTFIFSCDDGNNGHGNDDGHFDPSNPGQGHGPNIHSGNGHNSGHKNANTDGTGRYSGDSDEVHVNMYPNPTKGITHITWDIDEPVEVSVYHMNGAEFYRQAFEADVKEFELEVNSSGMYFIEIYSGDKQVWKGKLIKN